MKIRRFIKKRRQRAAKRLEDFMAAEQLDNHDRELVRLIGRPYLASWQTRKYRGQLTGAGLD